MPKGHDLSSPQKICLVILRMAIGWHMLSEGVGKLTSLNWSSAGYLTGAFGPFSSLFQKMTQEGNEWLLQSADLMVTYGLVIAGASLLLGMFTRLGCVLGMMLLTLFYVSMPPWEWTPIPGTESNYLIVNKNVIEGLGLLIILMFPTGRFAGLDSLLYPLLGRYFPSWLVGEPSNEA
jgi:thiosulfate dehydrogenase [quinone] large subunit